MRKFVPGALLLLAMLLPLATDRHRSESPVPTATPESAAAPTRAEPDRVVESLPPPVNTSRPDFVPDQLLVRFNNEISASRRAQLIAASGANVIRDYRGTEGLILLQLPRNSVVDATASLMASYDEVAVAEPNFFYYKNGLPNDPRIGAQWALHNNGQGGGVRDVDINAPEAWDEFVGNQNVVIGVIDSGIDYRHPDLAQNVWVNPNEIPDNGIDDDGNGWVDDMHGINAIIHSSDPDDDEGHGTLVSGVIAARGNNGIGVSGVMWKAQIASCKFLNMDGRGKLSDALTCIEYFKKLDDGGVNLIATNNSWGGKNFSQLMLDAILEHRDRGILFVAATSNNGKQITDEKPDYPSGYDPDNIISVASHDLEGKFSAFSSFSSTRVDIAAPGKDILSTARGGGYKAATGTSMAAPHVTGVVGLLKAYAPGMSARKIRTHILTTGVSEPDYIGKVATFSRLRIQLPFIDADVDGMSDRWEQRNGFDPKNPDDAAKDPDKDGLTNLEEYLNRTDPRNKDTDDDGLNDGVEVQIYASNPLLADSDDDGLDDYAEVVVYGTNPLTADTDGDGLGDKSEIDDYATDPTSSDTDADDLPDGWEIEFGFNPLLGLETNIDTDQDGLSNLDEYLANTNPRKRDTDKDGLSDGDEVHLHHSSPLQQDTDSDRMHDGWEVSFGLDPLDKDGSADPDNDEFPNVTEFDNGTDPTDPASIPPITAWATLQGNARRSAHAPYATNATDFRLRWQLTIPESQSVSDVTTMDRRLFITRWEKSIGFIESINLSNGATAWTTPLINASNLSSPQFDNGQMIVTYSNNGAWLELIDTQTGEGTSKFQLERTAYPRTNVAMDGTVVTKDTYDLALISTSTGEATWRQSLRGDALGQSYSIAMNDQFVVMFANTTLYVYNRKKGNLKHAITAAECEASDWSALMLDANSAYAVHQNCASRFDLKTGLRQWQTSRNYLTLLPAMDHSSIYLTTDTGIESIDRETGASNWFFEQNNIDGRNIVTTQNHLFVPLSSKVIAIDLKTRQKAWSYPVTGRLAVSDDGALIIRTDDKIFSINIDGDFDNDGMPNWWERLTGFNYRDASDGTLDSDSDGLTNLEEFNLGTDPHNADSDSDELDDGAEINIFGTSPSNPDTDNDGLTDNAELNVHGTDPLRVDTDGDGISDRDEIVEYGTNPNDRRSRPVLKTDYRQSFESGMPDDWRTTQNGDVSWHLDPAESTDGNFSLRTDLLGPKQTAAIKFTSNFAAGELSFDVKTKGFKWRDELEIYVDGQLAKSVFSAKWERVTITVPAGRHSIRFSYTLPSKQQEEYIAWIDDVRFRVPPRFARDYRNMLVVADNELLEFDRHGKLVREPMPIPFAENARDLVVTMDHKIAIADAPRLHLFDPATEIFSHTILAGWGPGGYMYSSGLAAYDNFILATNGRQSGVHRFNLAGEFVDTVLANKLFDALEVGGDGYLYGIRANSADVNKISLTDFSIVKTLELEYPKAVAVDTNGRIYTTSHSGEIRQFDASGSLLASVPNSSEELDMLNDLALSLHGDLFTVGENHDAAVSDTDFSFLKLFKSKAHYGETATFVASVPKAGIDSDGDGAPDWWEVEYGLDPNSAGDGPGDLDNDGLANADEYTNNAYPTVPDSDQDGLLDGEEVNTWHSDPIDVDSDDDLLSDYLEATFHFTDPARGDSDEDGLDDGLEVLELESNPLDPDSDHDGMSDHWEFVNGLDLGRAADKNWDPDDDGLTNLEEFLQGTAMREPDTDLDGLLDGEEVFVYFSSPLLADSDGDELPDGWEVRYGFDPNLNAETDVDTDLDGFSNRQEYYADSNPLVMDSVPEYSYWFTHQGNNRHDGYVPVILNPETFVEAWSVDLQPKQSNSLLPITSGDGTAWAMARVYPHYRLYSIDAATGATRWSREISDAEYATSATIGDGHVFVQKRDPGGAFMLGFDAETGSQHLETQYSVFYQDIRAPAYHDGHLYGFAHQDGGVGSFSATASKLKWTFRVDRHQGWSPVVDQNRVIVYSQDGLNVLNRTTGGLRYTIPDPQYGFRVADRVQSPVYDGRDSVFVTQFNRLLRFDLESRSIAWTMEFGDNTLGQAALANGTVYVVDGGELVAIDAARGEHLWRWAPRRNILSDLVVTVDHIFVATSRRTIAFNLNTRKIDWSHPVPGRLSLGNDGILYIATDKAEIVAIRVFPDPAGPQ